MDQRIDELDSRLAIGDLVQGWMYRDLGQWDKLRTTFHPDGFISVTWFEGKFSDFVNASEKQSALNGRTKHFIGSPLVERNNNRAIAETNAIILVELYKFNLGCEAHCRLYDLVERREGSWKIYKRFCFYDMANFTYSRGDVQIDQELVSSFPHEYAPLSYLQALAGIKVDRILPTRGSDQERAIRAESEKWLSVS